MPSGSTASTPAPASAWCRTSAPGCRRHWSKSARRWCSCPVRRASEESACRSRLRGRGGRRGSHPLRRRRGGLGADRANPVHPPQRSRIALPSAGGVAPRGHAGVAALRDQRDAMLAGQPDDRRDLFGRSGSEDGGASPCTPSAPVAQPGRHSSAVGDRRLGTERAPGGLDQLWRGGGHRQTIARLA